MSGRQTRTSALGPASHPTNFTSPTPWQMAYARGTARNNRKNIYNLMKNVDIIQAEELITTNVAEGTNMYYTDARADARITAQKGTIDGLATLDSSGKVPNSQLNLDSVTYQGSWNANTNTPTLADGTGTIGQYYIVSVSGSTNIDGETDWQVSDWIIFNGTVWEKSDHSNQVSSVAGKQGDVTLVSADITDLTTTTVPEGSNLYYTEVRVSANTDVVANVTHAASTSNPHSVTKAQVGLGNVEDLKVKLDATIAPTVNNDTSEGYVIGSRWIDVTNDKEYVCLDNTATVAVWKLTSATTTSEVVEGSNLYYTTARFDTRLATKDTDDVAEGTNFYYTDARFDTRLGTKSTTNLTEGSNLYYTEARVSANTDVAANVTHAASSSNPHSVTKIQVGLGNVEDLKVKLDATVAPTVNNDTSEGYVVGSRWIDVTNDKEYVCLDNTDTAAVWKLTSATTTSEVSEGSNLYYTDARFDTRLATKDTDNVAEGTNLYYTDARFDTRLGTKDTDDVAEGTNLYYTEARVSANTDVVANVAHSASSSNPHTVTKAQVGLGNVEDLKVKLDATTSPTVNNDTSEGYVVGSRWIDVTNDKEYVCLDNTDGAAVWKLTSATTTSEVVEGSNLYYTDTRFDTRLGTKTTTNLAEGSNLYYSEARVSANTDVAANVTHAANSTNPHTVTKTQVGLGNVEDLKVKLDATVTPTVNNDTSEGYVVGSRWIDVTNDKEYVCLDNTDGAAVWKLTSATTTSEVSEGSNLYYTDTRFDTRLGTKTTTNLAEGSNLYYTEARVSANTDVAANVAHAASSTNPHSVTKAQVGLENVEDLKVKLDATTAPTINNDTSEGYVVGSRWIDVTNDKEYVCLDNTDGAAVWKLTSATTTSEVAEGSNLYYTDARFDTRLGTKTTTNLTEGSNLYYTDARFDTRLVTKDTGDLTEGSNLYYTDARADARITAQKGAANGLATLDGGGKVPASQLDLDSVDYQGTWNATTNTPTLVSSTGTKGYYYVVSVTGSTSIDSITDWQVGDWIIFNGTVWEKADHSDQVTSIAGKQGVVTLVSADITDLTTSNVTEGSNLYYTEARVSANTDVAANVTHAASSSNPHTVTKSQVSLGNVEDLKVKLDATTAPIATNDTSQGYAVGSRWIDVTNDKEYVCLNATATAAVWKLTSATTTSEVSEGSNLYYTDARFDTRLGTKSTTNLTEGSSNLYYTEARVSANTDVAANVTHAASSSNPHTVTKAQVSLGNVQNLKVKLDATAGPAVTDDSGSGYAVGSRWIDVTNDKEYVCVDATSTAAVWVLTTATEIADLPALSIKRTTAFTTSGTADTYTDITFNTTVLENAASIIEHHNTNTERVTIKETGAYQISFAIPIIHTNITIATARIYKNGTTEVGDSEVHSDHTHGDIYLYNTVVASLTQNDYITLQVKSDGTSENTGTPIVLSVVRLKGLKGDKGDTGSGTNLTIKDEGLNVTNTPHGTLNFVGSLVAVTDNADGSADVTIGAQTFRIPHSWNIKDEIKVPSGDTDFIIPFFVSFTSGQTAKIVKARHKINAGTSVTCKLQKNDVDITGFTSISVTTTTANIDPTDVSLAEDDKLALVVTGVSGIPKNLSFTIFIEYTQ